MSIRSRWSAAVSGLLSALLVSVAATVAVPVQADTDAARGAENAVPGVPHRFDINLPRGDRGRSALARLKATGRLSEWGAQYGMSAAQVENMFNRDRNAEVDRRGRLKFVERIDRPLPATTTGGTQISNTTVPANILDQVFALHSRAGSQRKLYLDFNGHVTQGTAWNDSYGLASITSPAFDLDGNPGTFSAAERQVIYGIWQRVKEDFSAFDIDVTTEEPPADQMTRSSAQDTSFGVRMVITRDFTPGTAEGACQCGGFAYVGVYSMDSEFYKPAFVFYNNLGSSEKFVAEAVTHEAGHTMGLSHDGQGTLGYYEGQGTGTATGWAPIMGVGYYKPLTQWSKGEYSNANNKEDDYMVMQANGVRFAPDEHGNTMAASTALTATVENGLNRFSSTGVIQGPLDIDFFRFTAGAGTLTINVKPDAYDPNLDVVATLLNANGTAIATANPLATLDAPLTFNVTAPGTYYLSVRGTGNGNPGTTGYSAYGSIGSYSVDVLAGQSTVTQPPPVSRIAANPLQGNAPLSVTFNGSSSTGTGTLSYLWQFGDGTQSTAANPPAKVYQNAGSYTVTLRVTDSSGQSNLSTTTIRALAAPTAAAVFTQQITLAGVVPNPSRPDAFARATVTVRDAQGRAVRNARVFGSWSGVVTGTVNGLTDVNGVVRLNSPTTPFVGTFTFTMNNITATGFVYDPSRNVVTSRSITF